MDAKCLYILQDLKARLRSFHKEIGKTKYRTFCNPVDTEKYPDYKEIIDTPMDLGLMMSKVDSDQYEVPEDWLADIELIWDNARRYNEARSDIVHKAAELRDDARAFVQGIPSKYRLNYLQAMLWRRTEVSGVSNKGKRKADDADDTGKHSFDKIYARSKGRVLTHPQYSIEGSIGSVETPTPIKLIYWRRANHSAAGRTYNPATKREQQRHIAWLSRAFPTIIQPHLYTQYIWCNACLGDRYAKPREPNFKHNTRNGRSKP